MLKERSVARFIVAPEGYGKTFLALGYAETMFSWVHAFWINAQSPCFIRDLDAGEIAGSCLACDAEAALVVFDGLPALDSHRMKAFSREVDLLLAADCEVVVTCVPTADMVGGLQRDRIRIGARDLLLDDVELDDARTADERVRTPAIHVGPAMRVPALLWSTSEFASHEFAKAALYEEMPADVLFVMASAFVLRAGAVDDLTALGQVDEAILAELLDDYPHLGFDDGFDLFDAVPLSVEALASPLKERLPELVARSAHDAPGQLVLEWAEMLVANGHAGRACDLVREVCPRRKRAAWLIDHAHALVSQTCIFPTLRIARDQDSCKGEMRMRLNALEGFCRMLLGDEDGALTCVKRHAFDASAPPDVRACDLLVAARLEKGALAPKVREALESLLPASDDGRSGSASPSAPASAPDWQLLVRAWLAGEQGPLELAKFWCARFDEHVGDDALCLCASWLFGLLDAKQALVAASPEVRRCERYVAGRLQVPDGSEPDYFAASAGLSLESARARGVRGDSSALGTGALIQLRKVEMDVLAQRRLFEEDVRAIRIRRNDWEKTHPVTLSGKPSVGAPSQRKRSVPILTLRMFGHLEVTIGGTVVEPKSFNRRNARTLLVLLAVNQGRELSRETVERALWPQSSEEVAHKNFYTVWSSLRRALMLPDGTCPYLVRHQLGCRLDNRYVQSDAERLSEICRELLFGVPNVDRWSTLFAEIDRDFSSDLLPAEQKNRLVVQARNEYRTRLVDALVAATASIVEVDSPQWGIWFARAALSHDETREDAYIALMRAQIAGNQRTAAMMTYLKCRRVLADRLGIDPSPEITSLYESLLDVG